ncbi:MAG: DNA repair protein RadC [Candidatus Omnitrophica bacterium]|nr:DNA repair protein RadC [Candidatus Omnitrophota bacterium]
MITKEREKAFGQSIKSWPISERPRELLLDNGPDCVSDAGLIAILLRSGTKGKDAVSLARDLIKHFGSLRGLLSARKADLEKIKGLGQAKIAQLMAVIEIAKRQLKEEIIGKPYIENEKDVMDYLSLTMRDLKEEFFKVSYLNKANIIISVEDLAKGTIDQSSVYPREIIKRALEIGSCAIVCVHNHPSGNLEPSKFDIEVTKRLTSACQAVDITPLDHIIVSPPRSVKLKKQGCIFKY